MSHPAFNNGTIRFWKSILRDGEQNSLTGVPYYIASALLAFAIFPEPIAILSILYLACGDPAASLFGILYGKKWIRFSNGKSLVGTLAAILVCLACSFVVLLTYPWEFPLDFSKLVAMAFLGSIAGGTTELIPVEVDDNLSIPLVSGFVLWIVHIL